MAGKLKIAAIAGAVLLVVLTGAWGWEKYKAERDRREAAEAAAAERDREIEMVRLQTERLLEENNDLWLSVASWMARPPIEKTNAVYRDRIKQAPAECQDCLEAYRRPLEFRRDGVRVIIPDALLGDTAQIDIDQNAICAKWIELAGQPGDEAPPNSSPSSRLFRRGPIAEIGGGYGASGIDAFAGSWPLEMGSSKFIVQAGGYAHATWREDGTVDGNVAAGIRLQIR